MWLSVYELKSTWTVVHKHIDIQTNIMYPRKHFLDRACVPKLYFLAKLKINYFFIFTLSLHNMYEKSVPDLHYTWESNKKWDIH
jgi:hypothetical protein